MEMKKIFLLVDMLQGSAGGAEKQILELSKNIDRSKYSLIVGCLSGKDALLNELSKSGVLTISFKIKRIYDIFGIIQGLKFKKFLRDKKVDILMTYHFGSDIWGTIFGRLARVPVIISNRRDMGFWKKWYHNMAYKLINRFINKVIVVSDAVKQAVIRLERLSLDKVVVVRNGIDLSHFKTSVDKYAIKNSLGINENTFVIGCVGNIKNVKGQVYLIKALTEVRRKISNFKCIFIGGEFEKEAKTIKNYSHICGVNDLCLFLGKRNDIPNLLSIMDICVLPSLSEGFSNTLLEYMAAGKPVVATNVGGNPEVIEDKINGMLAKKKDSEDLAGKIVYLLKNKEERTRLGLKAKEDIKNGFSIEEMAQKYENLFSGLMEAKEFTLLNKNRHAIPAIILGMTANGLSIARSLGRKGITVIGIDSDGKQPGMFSRYCKHLICPNVIRKEEEFIKFLIGLGESLQTKGVLFITADEYILSISRNREKIYPYFNFILPEQWIVESFLDKRKSYDLAEKNELLYPKTYFINDLRDLEKIINEIRYPCALKPVYSHLWRIKHEAQKLVVVNSAKDIITSYIKIRKENLQVMVQEIISGSDNQIFCLMTYFNKEHRPLAVFIKRKLRQYPIHFGIASFSISERNQELINTALNFLSKINYTGFAGIEFKRDSRDGRLKFTELNLRTLMSNELAIACGVDLPYICYQDLTGEKVDEVYNFKEGIKLVNLELDIASLWQYRKLKEITFFQWLNSFRGNTKHTYFAWDDPVPFLFVCFRFTKTLFRKITLALLNLLKYRKTASPRQKEANDKINILHFISSNGLFGAEKVMLSLASNMNFNGLRLFVAMVKNSQNPHLELIIKAQEKSIPTFIVESNGRFDLKSVSRLYDFIKENNIDILHTHNYKANFIGLAAAKRAEIPIVATLHGYIDNGRKLRFYESIDRFILRFFDKVILVDSSLKRWFKNGSVKYEVINNGVDIKEVFVNPQTRQLANSPTKLTIGTVGRLSEEKGHKYLIEAFAKLAKDYRDIRLLIVGDGEIRKDLENLSISLGIKDRLTFTGFQEDVTKYYSLMDIYVSSSLVEHFPMSILEAMSFKKAIVATNVGGTADLIKNERTGILINPSSSESIYQALLRYIREPELIKKLGDNACQFVRNSYSVERMVNEYRKVYEDTLCSP